MSSVPVAIKNKLRRREYHGDREHVALEPRFAFSWMSYLEQHTRGMHLVCSKVMDKHEAAVRRFGYSLREPRQRVHSDVIAPFMVPHMLPTDPF